jgi:predicted MPP superfamily phosphohydrolase
VAEFGADRIAQRLRARFVRGFFAHFFQLLTVVVSVSEWIVLWWVWPQGFDRLPLLAWVGGPLYLYAANRWLALRAHHRRFEGRATRIGPLQRLYYAAAFTCIFCVAFLLLTAGAWAGAKLFLGAITAEAHAAHTAVSIDSSLDTGFRWLADAGMAAIVLCFTYGYTVGQLKVRVRHLHLPLRRWPTALHGLRIVQISDLHIGQNLERAQLERFVARVNESEPDIVCITGDIIDSPAADIEGFLPVLANLRAKHGVFAILGNHDHYTGADRVEAALRRLTPFTVLRDQHIVRLVSGQHLHVIGLDDHGRDWARGVTSVPYLSAVLAAIPADEPVLLLSHRPDVFLQAAAGNVALTLAGHTHGGQIGIPWFKGRVRNLAEFITAFDRGLFERDGAYLYVNCGLGVTGQRIRLSTPREITIIEAQSVAAAETRAA